MVGNTGVRQIGFQETPIVEICKSITKSAVTITDPNTILYELEKAVHTARSGRPGPVLIDIPDNLQRAIIDDSELAQYKPQSLPNDSDLEPVMTAVGKLLDMLADSDRPIIVAGWGLHLSGTEKSFIRFVESLNIPVVMTWGAADILPHNHPLHVGTFGTHGTRHANFAIQNADLVVSLGSRLDTKATGTPVNSFARNAKKVIIDIDINELNKFESFGLHIDLPINLSLQQFFGVCNFEQLKSKRKKYEFWLAKIEYWRSVSRDFNPPPMEESGFLDPYQFIEAFSQSVGSDARVFVDTGCSIAWTMQAAKFSEKTRVFHDFNNTAMGWALPASIGSYFAKKNGPIYCIVGDGSFMMTMHELATVMHHNIPIKIVLMNNSGYGMIQQTQDQWLNSDYYASSHEGGLSFPEYENLAKSFNIDYVEINGLDNLDVKLMDVANSEKAVFCNILLSKKARVSPQVKFGRPNEDMEPLLPRDIFKKCMIISEPE